jgi:hypothetical protein
MMRLKHGLVIVAAAALAANALASGWDVTIMTSQGVLNPDGVVVTVPFTTVENPLPSITFNTNLSSPPITVGDGTSFTNGTFTGIYTVQDTSGTKAPLTGFTFVVGGFVWEFGQIIAFKKVIDLDTNEVLFTGSWVWSGGAYPGGANGAINFNQFFPLAHLQATSWCSRCSCFTSMERQHRALPRRPCNWWSRTGCRSRRACWRWASDWWGLRCDAARSKHRTPFRLRDGGAFASPSFLLPPHRLKKLAGGFGRGCV